MKTIRPFLIVFVLGLLLGPAIPHTPLSREKIGYCHGYARSMQLCQELREGKISEDDAVTRIETEMLQTQPKER